jgi:hypothetical protein
VRPSHDAIAIDQALTTELEGQAKLTGSVVLISLIRDKVVQAIEDVVALGAVGSNERDRFRQLLERVDANRTKLLAEIRGHRITRNTIGSMRSHFWIGGQRNRHETVFDIEAGTLRRRGDDRERFDADGLELFASLAEQSEIPATERTLESAHEREKEAILAAEVGKRHESFAWCARQSEVPSRLSRL